MKHQLLHILPLLLVIMLTGCVTEMDDLRPNSSRGSFTLGLSTDSLAVEVETRASRNLTEAEQTAFNESFAEVSSLLDASFEDWTANRDAFKDGREARMDELITEPMYRNAWNVLKAATLAMAQ